MSQDQIHQVVVCGTGFAGLCMAIKLKQAGIEDFIILERANSVGGTWRDNTYPGAACDVPARLYSFSFEQKPDWSRTYPTQPELKAYLENVAEKYGLMSHMCFGHNIEEMRWQDDAQHWLVQTSQGQVRGKILVSGCGGLAEPKLPDIPGVEKFQGEAFHSATWNHDYDLQGKNVAVIGSGASAIQFVPEVAPQAARLDVYQRTPNWVIPRADRNISRLEKWLLKAFKPYRAAMRNMVYWGHEARVFGIVVHPALMKIFQQVALRHIRKQVADPQLRAQVTPDYLIGCRRILISNDWYPALARKNVDLVTQGIREIREHSIVDQNGQEREVDALVFGTGFYATENPMAAKVFGLGGRQLSQDWADGEHAYLGTAVNGYPNLFFLVGPNTGLGHSSMVLMIEAQVKYVMQAVQHLIKEDQPMQVRAEVETVFNDKLQKTLGGSVWANGCDSWYQHKSGKITTLWPGFTFNFMRATRRFFARDYQTV